MLGREIAIGDWVAYPTTAARSPVMKIGVVEKLESYDQKVCRWVDGERIESTRTQWKIGIRRKFEAYWGSTRAPENVQLSYPKPSNVLRIDPPEE